MPSFHAPDHNRRIEVQSGTTVVDLCAEFEIPLEFGCQAGNCGTCRVEVLEGATSLEAPNEHERATLERVTDVPGARLACQLVVNADLSLRAVD